MQTVTNYLFFKKSYLSLPSVLIIPPGKSFSPFEKLIFPFRVLVWYSLLLILVSMSTFISFYKRYQTSYGSAYKFNSIDILIIIFGGSLKRLPQRNHARIILATFLLFTLVMRGLYQGAVFQFIQMDKRHSEIHSIDEMIEKGFNFYMYPSYQEHFKEMKFYSRWMANSRIVW